MEKYLAGMINPGLGHGGEHWNHNSALSSPIWKVMPSYCRD